MNQLEARNKFYDLTAMFFRRAAIRWSESIGTKPNLPYVELKSGRIKRTAFPREDNEGNRVYDCSTIVEVKLYTLGSPVAPNGNVICNYENTAVSDLTDFTCFMESEAVTEIIAGWGMDISLMGEVRDLTALLNDTKYRYQAMAEFTVSYAMEANGPYGVSNMDIVPNASGGATIEMVAAESPEFDTIEIDFSNY